MALYNGIDTVAFVSGGVYTETYVSATGGENIASLFASQGMLESSPAPTVGGRLRGKISWLLYHLRSPQRRGD